MTGRHYYTHVLWAIEQLLQQKKYVGRAVDWLWKMNSYEIKYSMNNSPKSTLEVVFCAWTNTSVLSVDAKICSAKKAIILKWEQMKCMQLMMKTDPTIYARLVGIIYKSDEDDEVDEKKADLANKVKRRI